jgi:hypothetical protein
MTTLNSSSSFTRKNNKMMMNFNLSLHFVTRKKPKKNKDNDELRFIIVFYNTKNNNNKNEAKFIYMH